MTEVIVSSCDKLTPPILPCFGTRKTCGLQVGCVDADQAVYSAGPCAAPATVCVFFIPPEPQGSNPGQFGTRLRRLDGRARGHVLSLFRAVVERFGVMRSSGCENREMPGRLEPFRTEFGCLAYATCRCVIAKTKRRTFGGLFRSVFEGIVRERDAHMDGVGQLGGRLKVFPPNTELSANGGANYDEIMSAIGRIHTCDHFNWTRSPWRCLVCSTEQQKLWLSDPTMRRPDPRLGDFMCGFCRERDARPFLRSWLSDFKAFGTPDASTAESEVCDMICDCLLCDPAPFSGGFRCMAGCIVGPDGVTAPFLLNGGVVLPRGRRYNLFALELAMRMLSSTGIVTARIRPCLVASHTIYTLTRRLRVQASGGVITVADEEEVCFSCTVELDTPMAIQGSIDLGFTRLRGHVSKRLYASPNSVYGKVPDSEGFIYFYGPESYGDDMCNSATYTVSEDCAQDAYAEVVIVDPKGPPGESADDEGGVTEGPVGRLDLLDGRYPAPWADARVDSGFVHALVKRGDCFAVVRYSDTLDESSRARGLIESVVFGALANVRQVLFEASGCGVALPLTMALNKDNVLSACSALMQITGPGPDGSLFGKTVALGDEDHHYESDYEQFRVPVDICSTDPSVFAPRWQDAQGYQGGAWVSFPYYTPIGTFDHYFPLGHAEADLECFKYGLAGPTQGDSVHTGTKLLQFGGFYVTLRFATSALNSSGPTDDTGGE